MGARRLHPAERVAEYTARGWWGHDTLDALFRDRVREHPDRLAIVDPANKAELIGRPPRRLTWAELDAGVDRFAAVLLANSLGQGDVVGVQLPNSTNWWPSCGTATSPATNSPNAWSFANPCRATRSARC
jgi:acyl-CoA synthetase